MKENIWTNDYNPFNSMKLLCWRDRMESIYTGRFQSPVNIALDVIQGTKEKKACGKFKCNFCMSDLDDHGKESRVPEDLLLTMPRFFNEWGVLSLCIAGNHSDPCMYHHATMIEFLRLCNRWNVEVGYVSNGAYYTDKLLHEVIRQCVWSGWSINSGNAQSHEKITGTNTFGKVIDTIHEASEYIKYYSLRHDIGFKFLITDDNYSTILEGIETASKIGVRHFQIRPTELPVERTEKIDVKEVERQIVEGLKFERPGEFEIFGIREKFSTEFKKITPRACVASPLGSTWKADGDIVICPDRRWSAHKPDMCLGNFITEGLESIRRKWGGAEHVRMIRAANADIHNCIRCTSLSWHRIYDNTILSDPMNIKLI